MREKEMQGKVKKWIEAGGWRELKRLGCGGTVAMEFKTEVAGRAIGSARIEKHQIRGLASVEGWGIGDAYSGGWYHKFSDLSFGAKPFDAVYIGGARGYVVLGWYHIGKGYYCVWVRIRALVDEFWVDGYEMTKKQERRSISEYRASEIGELTAWV